MKLILAAIIVLGSLVPGVAYAEMSDNACSQLSWVYRQHGHNTHVREVIQEKCGSTA